MIGVERPSVGAKLMWGEDASRWSIAKVREKGVASIPDEPLALACVPGLTVRENLVLGTGRRYRARLGLDWQRLDSDMGRSFAQLAFPRPPFRPRAATLSGGNLQRLVLAREMAHEPRLIVALFPTRGLDARSTLTLHSLLRAARDGGAAVVIVSEDIDELFALSDRLVVLYRGAIAGEFGPENFRAEAVGPPMVGVSPMQRDTAALCRLASARTATASRFALAAVIAFGVFAALLIAAGKDPFKAYLDTLVYVFGNAYGFSELLVRMIPLLLTAVAVALPTRIGLINVGGEGQLYMGAWLTTAGALALSDQPAFILLPVLSVLGFVGGGVWALIPATLRALRLVNETISTLLLNYVAPLVVSFFIFGPWRSPESASYPQSPAFVEAARLPTFFHSRVNAGLIYGAACLVLYWLVMTRTRWGLEMRAIGGNPEAARRLGIPVFRYIVTVMFVAGGVAGIAGMVEVSAIQGRLVSELSPGYGFIGFLVSWLAGDSVGGIVLMSFLFAVVSSIGDVLQITQGLPFAVVNILMAVILFIVLGSRPSGKAGR